MVNRAEDDRNRASKKSTKKPSREKACLNWLLMLYYKGSRLKGRCDPSGIETFMRKLLLLRYRGLKGRCDPSGIETDVLLDCLEDLFLWAKRPMRPVRD